MDQSEIPSIRQSVQLLKERGILQQFEDILVHAHLFDQSREKAVRILSDFHKKNPLKPGMPKDELRALLNIEPRHFGNLITAVKDIVIDKELTRLATFKLALSQVDETVKTKILELLEKAGFQPPTREELGQSLKIELR